jgi:hypothetical protein
LGVIARLWVEVGADAKKFEAGIKGIQGKLTSLQKGFNTFGNIMTLGVTLPLIAAGKGMLDAGMQLEATEAKFNTVFKGMTDDATAFIMEFKKLTPLTIAEARGVASGIQDLLVPMGFAREEATELTGKFMPLIGALANFNNATHTAAEVANAVSSALIGEYEPMRRLGVVTSKTAIDQRVLEMGLAATKDEITDQMRAIALHEIITESSKDAIEAYTEANLDSKTKMGLLKTEIIDVAAQLGVSLLPIIQKVVEWVRNLTETFKKMTQEQQINLLKWLALAAAIGPASKIVAGILGLTKLFLGLKSSMLLTQIAAQTAATGIGSAAAPIAGVGTAAAATGGKLAALAGAGGPIALVVAALAIGAIYWSEYTKAMSRDMRNFEQVVNDSFNGIMSTMVAAQTEMEISAAQSNMRMLEDEIAYYNGLDRLTAEEQARLTQLIDEANKERTYIASLELIERQRAAEKFAEDIKRSEAKTNDEIIKMAEDRRTELVATLDKETADRIHEIDKRHAKAGTINSKAHRDEIAAEKKHYGERLALINEQMGQELQAVQRELSKRGLVYDQELGKIITVQDKHHRNMQSKLQTDMAAMRSEYNILGRKNVQEYKRGIDSEAEGAVNASRNMGIRSREALKGGGAYEAGAGIGNAFASGIGSAIDTVIATAKMLNTAAQNALKNVEYSTNVQYVTSTPKSSTSTKTTGSAPQKTTTKPSWLGLFDTGGVVPGPIGQPGLAIVHGGETVLPTHKANWQGSGGNTIRHEIDLINVPATVDGASLERTLVEMLNAPAVKRKIDRVNYENQIGAVRGLGA